VESNKKSNGIAGRVLAGDKTAVPEFRDWLREHPEMVSDWATWPVELLLKHIGNLTPVPKTAPGMPLLAMESLRFHLDSLRRELCGPEPNPVEKLLVERVVACWLQVYHADLQALTRGECSPAQAAHDVRRQDRANRRFLQSCKTLANIRRLALPLDVNVNLAAVVAAVKPAAAIPLERFQLATN
jgi:hypothetical protein